MFILKTDARHQKFAIREACRVLKRGGVVALPTETTYGLACDPRSAKTVAKIFSIKGRNEKKPLQLIAGSWAQIRKMVVMHNAARRLAEKYWPGPLTLLLPLKKGVSLASRVQPKKTVGIRISSHPFARALAQAFGRPIAATSANRSGSTPAFSGRGVVSAFRGMKHQPDLVLDIGSLPRRKPSTVARVGKDGGVEILRSGSIKIRVTSP